MGIRTVAVHSVVDRHAQHVAMADEAVCIGEAPSASSYLRQERVLEAMAATGAQAVHPGYGFLSENAEFSAAVQREGLQFIGPGPEAIRQMGDKITSMGIAQEAGVSCAPHYHGAVDTVEEATQIAEAVGYPVILKASAGGGGKGMRVAWEPSQLADEFTAARKEAASSFGDDRMLVQHYVCPGGGRHIEIQVLGDRHGNYVALNERECSVQRRHQKVIEEAPSVLVDPEMRAKMGEQAIALAAAVGYESAGTVEFLVDPETRNWYFLEMNTRLQVEHPVTEFITGVDLVEQMINVAAGRKLTLTQEDVQIDGWAVEARVYAEDPANEFRPGSGPLKFLRTPEPSAAVRVDSGVREGDEISIFYDPMIAKLVTHGTDREHALNLMRRALRQYNIVGLPTNIPYCADIVDHPAFRSGDFDTGFIAAHEDDLLRHRTPTAAELAQAALAVVLAQNETAAATQRRVASDPASPWASIGAVGDGTGLPQVVRLRLGEEEHPVTVRGAAGAAPGAYTMSCGRCGWTVHATGALSAGTELTAEVDGEALRSRVVQRDGGVHLFTPDGELHFELPEPDFVSAAAGAFASDVVAAPMNGSINEVYVVAGEAVTEGQPVALIFAMKMETVLRAPRDGVVAAVQVAPGDQVTLDATIVQLEPEEEE